MSVTFHDSRLGPGTLKLATLEFNTRPRPSGSPRRRLGGRHADARRP